MIAYCQSSSGLHTIGHSFSSLSLAVPMNPVPVKNLIACSKESLVSGNDKLS